MSGGRTRFAIVVFEAACLGFSGGVVDKELYSREFIRSNASRITHDAEIALTGATGGEPGIIVIAGTGSIAFGKNATGMASRAGGWGYIFGDEGSAFDIVRQALRAALAMEEGWGAETSLRASFLSSTGAVSANELMHEWYNSFDRVKVAALAPMVDSVANRGDGVATAILQQAGRKLAALVAQVHRKLFHHGELVAVSWVGGVFESGLLTEAWRRAVEEDVEARVSAPSLPPAAGALLEAFRLAGRSVRLSEVPAQKV